MKRLWIVANLTAVPIVLFLVSALPARPVSAEDGPALRSRRSASARPSPTGSLTPEPIVLQWPEVPASPTPSLTPSPSPFPTVSPVFEPIAGAEPAALGPEWPEDYSPPEPLTIRPPTPAVTMTATPPPAPTPRPPIVCEGDRVRYQQNGEVIVGEGNVRLAYKTLELTADKVTVYVARKEAFAEGNVILTQGDNVITTDKLRYDFIKEQGFMAPGAGYYQPWFGRAENVETEGKQKVGFTDGFATTCDLNEPHYRLQAGSFAIYPDDKIVAHNVVFYLGDIPLLWLPYYRRSLKDRCRGFFLYPGYKSSWGFYFLSGYHWCAPGLFTTFHLDYRYRNGLAYGFDGRFYIGDKGAGEWQTYYLKDQNYDEGGESGARERYLSEFWYRHNFPANIRANLSLHYLSDDSLRREFFRKEYDSDSQPSSSLFLNKRADNWTVSLEALARLNDFYEVNEKLPEATFDVKEIQLWDTNFYYQGANSFTSYRKKEADRSSTAYHADRFDTYHQLTYSDKYFGWLNIFPAVSIRETYYSRGPGRTEEEEAGGGDGEEADPSPTPAPTPDPPDRKDFWRRVSGFNLGISTAIYGIFPAENEWLRIHKLRHVIEPSINYYFTDQPTVTADEIYQFDSIDKISRQNYTRLKLRNILQTKHLEDDKERSWNLIDLILSTNMATYPDRDNNGRLLTNLESDLEITPLEWIGLDLELSYDFYDREIDEETLDLWVRPEHDNWWISLGHNYRRSKDRNRLSSEFYFRINPKWAAKFYGRYSFEKERFEEESLTIYRDLHCWDSYLRLRYHEETKEFEAFLSFWIKAFPGAPIFLSN